MPYAKKPNYSINIVQKNYSPIISLILLLKPRVIKSISFYYAITFIKFIPFLILTSNFALNKSNTLASEITFYFRLMSAYTIIKNGMSVLNYSIICLGIGIFELIYFIFLTYYYIRIKKRNRLCKIKINVIVIIIFHINFIFAQIFCEFLAFKLHCIYFKDKFPIKSSVSVPFQGIISFINIIVILFINASNYIIFLTVNTPFYQDESPVKIKMSIPRFVFCVIVENLIIIQCFELFLEGNALIAYKITICVIIVLSFTLMFFALLNKYNFKTPLNNFMAFLCAYNVFSLLIEIILYLTNFYSETIESNDRSFHTYLKLFFVFFWKIVISVLFLSFGYSISDNILISHLKDNLFKLYENKIEVNVIDDFYFFFDQLISLRDTNKDIKEHKLLNMILEHKKECLIEDCKCKIIQLIPENTLSNSEFLINLVSRIGYLFETTFVQLDYSVDFNLATLIAEYFSLFKSNNIMAYSIVQTCLHTNIKKLEIFEVILFYSLTNKYVTKLNNEIDKEHFEFIDNYYMNYKNMKNMNKMMVNFTDGYDKLISCKENFESTLKINYEYESKEISSIQSSFLTSEHVNLILAILDKLKLLYGDITKEAIRNLKNKMPFEYSLKIFLFYYMYNCKKIPNKINRLFEKEVNYLSELYLVSPTAMDSLLNYYYSSQSYSHSIIIKCHKGFKIELFSEKLASELGYDHNSLIGEDMSVLFPHHLRECHNKAMINYFITNHNLKIKAKKFIFTSNGQSVPIELSATSIPGLAKDYLIICNVNPLKEKNKYHFMLTSLYDTISLSNSFDVNYSLSLPIVKKFNINLLELFEIQYQSFDKLFKEDFRKIEEVKKTYTLSTNEMFADLLFHSPQMIHDLDANHRKFKIFDLQNNEKKVKQRAMRKSQIDIENFINNRSPRRKEGGNKIHLKRNKLMVAQNIFKLITMFTEFEVYDEEYKKLNEALCKFKNSINEIDSQNLQQQQKANSVKTGERQYAKECNINTDHYIIKIKMRLIYDTPIYLVSLKENQFNPPNSPSNSIDSPKNRGNFTSRNSAPLQFSHVNNLTASGSSGLMNKTNTKQTNHSRFSNHRNNMRPSLQHVKTLKNENDITITSTQETKKTIIGLNTSNSLFEKDTSYTKLTKSEMSKIKSKNSKIILGLLITLFISICLSIILFILQHHILNVSHSLFLIVYGLYNQKDKLLIIISSSLTLLYKYCNITESSYQFEDYIDLFKNTTHKFEESYHNFFKSITKFKSIASEENYNEILKELNFNKIQGNWEPIQYASDYASESYYLSFTALQSVQYDFELNSQLKDDIDMFLFDNYLKNPKKEVNSFLPVLLYFQVYNYDTTFRNYFYLIEMNIQQAFDDSISSFSTFYLITEFLSLGNYLLVFGLVTYYLYYNNRLIFQNILKMFLNPYRTGKSTSQNQYENFGLKQTIGAFSQILINFQKDVIRDFLNKYHKTKKMSPNVFNSQSNTMIIGHNNTNESTICQNITNPYNNDTRLSKSKIPSISGQGFLVHRPSSPLIKSSTTSNNNTNTNTNTNTNSNNTNTNNTNTNNNSINNKSSITQSSFLKLNTNSNSNSNNNTTNDNDYDNDYDINSSHILLKTKTVGVKVIKMLYIWLIILFLIMLLLFITKVANSLLFLNNIDKLFTDFQIVTLHYANAILYFNIIRIILISPSKGNIEKMKLASTVFDESRERINKLSSSELKEFPMTEKYFSMLLLSNNHSNFNPDVLCDNNTWCIDQVTQENNILANGVNIGIQVILLSFVNLFNDFINRNKPIESLDDIKALINVKDFTMIESAISFGVTKIQEKLLTLFYVDAAKVKDNYLLKVNLLNTGYLAYSLIVFAIVLFGIILNIRFKIQTILYGVYKFNRSLYFSCSQEIKDI